MSSEDLALGALLEFSNACESGIVTEDSMRRRQHKTTTILGQCSVTFKPMMEHSLATVGSTGRVPKLIV